MKKKIDLYYYSGTGNTLLIVREMTAVFKEHDYDVALIRMEDAHNITIPKDTTIGLAFPVAFQSTFPFIWSFFHSLPEGNGTPIFMVDTMMSFSGAIVGPLKKLLTSKGYACIGAKEIMMPTNYFPKTIDEDKNDEKVKEGLSSVRRYTEELIHGGAKWGRVPLLSDLFYIMCCNDYLMQNVNTAAGKKLEVDREKCRQCGICAKLCPTHNIVMGEDDHPRFGDTCEVCMRCLCFCPTEAISIPGKDFARYRAVKAKDLLSPK